MTKEEILETIKDKSKNYQVKFIKANGDERLMNFTQNHELIEDLDMTPKGTGSAIQNDDILKVVELCDNGISQWRSFRFDSVISVQEYNPES